MNNNHYDEQRNFARMSVHTQITYKIKDSDGRSHHGMCNDLSATGLYMSTDVALEEGQIIELVMAPSGDRLPPFVAEGKVLRTTIDEKNVSNFHVSIELTKTA
jgi:c-di-GMP-binding flagellar brake protein YcgR